MNQPYSFGEWLRRRRRALDWTQEELAKQAGCVVGTIRKIEADELRPSKQLAEILAQRLEVPIKDREDFVRFARGVLLDAIPPLPLAQETASLAPTRHDAKPTHNLPAQLTSFIGREREMAEVRQLLTTTRLLTLTGAGGTGKTRLALQVAAELLGNFPDGIWFVELAPLADPSLVVQSVMMTLGLREREGTPLETILKEYLLAKNLLILLDNCEHLVAACAQFADTFLRACPHLKILASSREALGVTGETTYRVPSLSSPAPTSDFQSLISSPTQYDAVRLFIDRAQMVSPSFQITNQNAPSVAQICYRLDGIPLAIELAAARIKGMKAEQIAQRLDDRFRLLTGGSRTALPHQQTLRATMDWSYSLLSETERKLLERLSVFAGGWTLEAAEAICTGDGIETNDILDLLLHLIDKSLVVVEEEAENHAARHRMLETIRQYAYEKLLDSGESKHVCDRHLDFYLKFAEDTEPKLNGADQATWFNRLETEHDNLRAALEWSLELGAGHERAELAMRLAGALTWFWIKRGYFNEGRNWLERSLESPTITPTRAKPLLRLGIINYFVGTNEKCHALCAESLALYRQQGDKWGITLSAVVCGARGNDPSIADALFEEARLLKQELKDEWLAAATDIIQGGYARHRGDFSVARSLFDTALDHARRSGDRWMIGNALENLGLVALDQGDDGRAAVLLTESLDFHREMGDQHQIANNLNGLGVVAERRHDFEQAETLFRQALELRREIGDTPDVISSIWALGRVAATEKRYERAARLFAATQALREKFGIPLSPVYRTEYESYLASARAQLDEATFNPAWNEGHAMTMEQAIEYALAE